MQATAVQEIPTGFVFKLTDEKGTVHEYPFIGHPLTRQGRVVALPPQTVDKDGNIGSTEEYVRKFGWRLRAERECPDEHASKLPCQIYWRPRGWSTIQEGRNIIHTNGDALIDVKWCVQKHAYFIVTPRHRRRKITNTPQVGIASPILVPRQCRILHPEEMCTVFDSLTEAQQVEVLRAKDLNRLIRREMRWDLAMLGIGTVDGEICQPVKEYLDAIIEDEQDLLHV